MATPGSTRRKYKCFTLWLDIPQHECPPNHYRLLGLPEFEQDAEKILAGANCVLAKVAARNQPEDVADATALRSYITKVASGLLNPQERAIYDGQLRQQLASIAAQSPAQSAQLTYQWDRSTVVEPYEDTVATSTAPPQRTMPEAELTPVDARAEYTPMPASFAIDSSGGGHVWKWIAGIAAANAIVLGGLVAWLLTRSAPVQPPVVAQAEAAPLSNVATPNPPSQNTTAPPPQPVAATQEIAGASTPPRALQAASSELPQSNTSAGAGTKSSGVRRTSGEEAAKEEPEDTAPPANPFEKVLDELDLPPVPEEINVPSKTVSAGKLHPLIVKDLSLELDSGASNLESVMTFKLQQQSVKKGKMSRLWRIVATASDVDEKVLASTAVAGTAIGFFLIDDNSNLRFHWELDESFEQADQLRNSVLVLKHGPNRKEINMRQALHCGRAPFDFTKTELRIPLQISDLPKDQLLAVTFKELKGVEVPLLFDEAGLTFENETDVAIGEQHRIKLLSELVRDKDSGIAEIVFRPKYYGDAKGRIVSTLSVKAYNKELGALMRGINKGVNDFRDALEALPQIRFELDRLQGQLNALNQQNAGQQQQFGQVSRAMERLRQQEGKYVNTVRRRAKSLPGSYEALARLISIGRMATQLQQSGELEYQLVSRSGGREIVLLKANGQPPPQLARATFEVPQNPNVAGPWIDCNALATFQLEQDGSFQVMTLDNPRPTGGGRWQQQKANVSLNGGGWGGNYTLVEDVLLDGATHKLYRAF